MTSRQYVRQTASPKGRALVQFGSVAPNPIRGHCRLLPLDMLVVGESMFVNVAEVTKPFLHSVRLSVRGYCRRYGEIFAMIKHRDERKVYRVLEIVRIK